MNITLFVLLFIPSSVFNYLNHFHPFIVIFLHAFSSIYSLPIFYSYFRLLITTNYRYFDLFMAIHTATVVKARTKTNSKTTLWNRYNIEKITPTGKIKSSLWYLDINPVLYFFPKNTSCTERSLWYCCVLSYPWVLKYLCDVKPLIWVCI